MSFICVGDLICAQMVAFANNSDGYNCSQALPVTGLSVRVLSRNEAGVLVPTPQPGSAVAKLSSNAALRFGLQPGPAEGAGALFTVGACTSGSATATLRTCHSLRSS